MNSEGNQVEALLRGASIVFWDFDGVIKDSVAVKSTAFEQMFLPYGREVADRIRQHHEAHGGVSRYEKMPIYLDWAGESATRNQVLSFCDHFAHLVRQAVIDAPWVPGVREYLLANHVRQRFVLVTATPQEEMESILRILNLRHCFCEVYGAPTSKATAIHDVLLRLGYLPENALMVGDSATDLDAAEVNCVPFLLRRTPLSRSLQARFRGPCFDCIELSGTTG